MKKFVGFALGLAMLATSCKKDLDTHAVQKELISGGASGVDTLVGWVTVNTTVTRTTYLKGLVYVRPGVTLTVNAGVTITGKKGLFQVLDVAPDDQAMGTLVIMPGAKLIANGTAAAPIVWTSSLPAGSRSPGDWGGIVFLGNAPYPTFPAKMNAAVADKLITSGLDPINEFGGIDPNDNSGSMTYCRIEFAGGVEVNSYGSINSSPALMLCAVGKGTTIHHVEVKNAAADGVRCLAGTVDLHHLVAFDCINNDYCFLQAYNGRLQFIIDFNTGRTHTSGSGDNLIRSYGGSGFTTPYIVNATLIGPTTANSFDNACLFNGTSGSLKIANSLIAGQAMPLVLRTDNGGSATYIDAGNPHPSFAHNDLFQSNATSPISDGDHRESELLAVLTGTASQNSVLTTYASFLLDASLTPQAGSPALSGGVNLSADGFVGTTERGAIITGDHWTSLPDGAWITTTTN